MIRVVIADDHAIVRQGINRVLGLASDMKCMAEARNGLELLALVRCGQLDIIVTDLTMPKLGGTALVVELKKLAPKIPVIVLSMHGEPQVAQGVIQAGASGYLTKDSEPDVMLDAIRRCASGGNYISSEVASSLLFHPRIDAENKVHHGLSNRELQVFLLLCEGRGISDIAVLLNVSAKTISTHKSRLMQKLKLRSTMDLIRYAITYELVKV